MKKICLIIGLLIILIPGIWFAYWYFGIYNPKTLIEYYPDGQIRYEYHQAYGASHGPQIDYYKNGQIYRQFHFDHGDPHGQFITYYENGQESDINYYYHGKQVGDSFSYRPTGEIRYQWRYIDGLPVDGESIVYYEDGSIEGKIRYKSGDILCGSTRYDRSGEIINTNVFSGICVEPVSEESEIGRNSTNLGGELLGNEEGVIFEPKKWKGQMPCIGGCDNGKDTEYVEGWYYEYTNPSLGVKITTPDGENGNRNNIFHEKSETPLFLLSGNAIYSLEFVRQSDDIEFAEFIKGYKKNPKDSLEELLNTTYGDTGCNLRKYNIDQNLGIHFEGAGDYYYEFVKDDGNIYNDCIPEEGDHFPMVFIESKNGERFYKIGIGDGCAPGPCSIFGKIELL